MTRAWWHACVLSLALASPALAQVEGEACPAPSQAVYSELGAPVPELSVALVRGLLCDPGTGPRLVNADALSPAFAAAQLPLHPRLERRGQIQTAPREEADEWIRTLEELRVKGECLLDAAALRRSVRGATPREAEAVARLAGECMGRAWTTQAPVDEWRELYQEASGLPTTRRIDDSSVNEFARLLLSGLRSEAVADSPGGSVPAVSTDLARSVLNRLAVLVRRESGGVFCDGVRGGNWMHHGDAALDGGPDALEKLARAAEGLAQLLEGRYNFDGSEDACEQSLNGRSREDDIPQHCQLLSVPFQRVELQQRVCEVALENLEAEMRLEEALSARQRTIADATAPVLRLCDTLTQSRVDLAARINSRVAIAFLSTERRVEAFQRFWAEGVDGLREGSLEALSEDALRTRDRVAAGAERWDVAFRVREALFRRLGGRESSRREAWVEAVRTVEAALNSRVDAEHIATLEVAQERLSRGDPYFAARAAIALAQVAPTSALAEERLAQAERLAGRDSGCIGGTSAAWAREVCLEVYLPLVRARLAESGATAVAAWRDFRHAYLGRWRAGTTEARLTNSGVSPHDLVRAASNVVRWSTATEAQTVVREAQQVVVAHASQARHAAAIAWGRLETLKARWAVGSERTATLMRGLACEEQGVHGLNELGARYHLGRVLEQGRGAHEAVMRDALTHPSDHRAVELARFASLIRHGRNLGGHDGDSHFSEALWTGFDSIHGWMESPGQECGRPGRGRTSLRACLRRAGVDAWIDYEIVPLDGVEHYVAFVSFARSHGHLFDLGTKDEIDRVTQELLALLSDPAQSPRAHATQLYRLILEPVIAHAGLTSGRIAVLRAGPLYGIPFAALHDGARYIGERVDIWYAHSVSALFDPSAPPDSLQLGPPLVVGDPDLTDVRVSDDNGVLRQPSALPGARDETVLVARRLRAFDPRRNAHVLIGTQASERAIREALMDGSPELVHWATHGVFRSPQAGDPPEAFLLFRPTQRTPNEDAGFTDGRLTAAEIDRLPFTNTSLVVLSACESGRGRSSPAEGPEGLRRAFLVAGVRSVVMSQWAVNDRATQEWMGEFYLGLAQGSLPSEAARAASSHVRRTQGHPYFWAAFTVEGRNEALVREAHP